ncbi:hypothetical protein E2562_013625, partial [Oryza meyeriana var. granulata]
HRLVEHPLLDRHRSVSPSGRRLGSRLLTVHRLLRQWECCYGRAYPAPPTPSMHLGEQRLPKKCPSSPAPRRQRPPPPPPSHSGARRRSRILMESVGERHRLQLAVPPPRLHTEPRSAAVFRRLVSHPSCSACLISRFGQSHVSARVWMDYVQDQ